EKQKLVKKINGKDQQEAKQTSEKIVDNVEKRKKEFKKEENALENSEEAFKKAQKHLDNISDKDKKKEVKEVNDALKDKYKAHDNYANSYKNIMNKEKELFEYGSSDQA